MAVRVIPWLARSLSTKTMNHQRFVSSSHKIVSIYQNGSLRRAHPQAISEAAETLKLGQVIATPTDTIYGIGALVQNNKAVERLYQIKGRDPKKPIAISVAEIDDIPKWSEVTVPRPLLELLLPGPVTVVFKRNRALNPDLNPDTHLIGIRIPDYDFIREVCRHCQGPIALTSANVSNARSSLSVEEFSDIHPSLDKIFDGGVLSDTDLSRLGSTVCDLSVPNYYRIIRAGCAAVESERILEKFGLKKAESING